MVEITHKTCRHALPRTLLMNLARYHLNMKAAISSPTFVLNPECMGIVPSSHNPADLSVSILSQTRVPALRTRRRNDAFDTTFLGTSTWPSTNLSDGGHSSSSVERDGSAVRRGRIIRDGRGLATLFDGGGANAFDARSAIAHAATEITRAERIAPMAMVW